MRILITGGSSEIGFAIAKRRFEMGDEVIITTSSQMTLNSTLEKFKESDVRASGFVFNLSNPEASKEDVFRLTQQGVQGVILNAASEVRSLRRFHDVSEQDYEQAIDTNIKGNLWLLQRLLEVMISQKFGRLVFISSTSAMNGTSRYGIYCLTKAAMEGLFLNLAVDYGEFNIFSNCVRPGIITTQRNERFWRKSHYRERMKEIIPSQSLGIPSQVAEVIDPLLSPTSYVNGSVISVSGGLPMLRSEGVLRV